MIQKLLSPYIIYDDYSVDPEAGAGGGGGDLVNFVRKD